MAISLSYFPIISTLLLIFFTFSEAAVVTYNFNITWVQANPDGQFSRPTIGINGKWPLPTLTATVNDTVIVNVDNQLGNQTTSLHFHGLYQNGTNEMDGPMSVTQCGIAPGSKFTYNFTVCPQSIVCGDFLLMTNRFPNQEHTGITHMPWGSTLVCGPR